MGGYGDNGFAGAAWVYTKAAFAGTPGKANCHGKSVSALALGLTTSRRYALTRASPPNIGAKASPQGFTNNTASGSNREQLVFPILQF